MSELVAHVDGLHYSVPAVALAPQRITFDAWPTYTLDKWATVTSTTTKPFLMFNGDLDISTPWDNAVTTTEFYNKTTQMLLRLPMVPHVGFLFSPLPNTQLTCGMKMAMSFFNSNGSSVDSSCIAEIIPLDFVGGGDSEIVKLVFGTADLWEYDGPPPIQVY